MLILNTNLTNFTNLSFSTNLFVQFVFSKNNK